jgi:hypothetical protein
LVANFGDRLRYQEELKMTKVICTT